MGMTRSVLPLPYSKSSIAPELIMVVDNVAHSFKVLLINNCTDLGNPLLRVYDSSACSYMQCSIIFEGMLDALFHLLQVDHFGQRRLWRYNDVEDVWEDTGTGVHIHRPGLHEPELVVSDNRVFLATWMSEDSCVWWLDISEISLLDKVRKLVFRMTNKLAQHVFDGQRPQPTHWLMIDPPGVTAFGSFKSIIWMSRSCSGTLMACD